MLFSQETNTDTTTENLNKIILFYTRYDFFVRYWNKSFDEIDFHHRL